MHCEAVGVAAGFRLKIDVSALAAARTTASGPSRLRSAAARCCAYPLHQRIPTEMGVSRHCAPKAMVASKRSFLVSCGALGVLALLACGKTEAVGTTSSAQASSASEPGKRVLKLAFVTNNPADFWKIAAAGVHKYEAEGKVQVDIKMPATGSVDEQNQILENLASQGYDAIAVSPVAPNDQVPILNKVALRSKLLTFDSDAPKSNRLLYIGTNNKEAGKALGREILKVLPHGGKMAVFVGSLAADNARQRFEGISEVVKPAGIEIVDKREDNTDRAKARSNVEDILNAHHDLDLVAGLYSYNGPAIAAALESLPGKKGKVHAAVFDEEDGTLNGISNGTVDFTVVQKPFMFGYLASKWMNDLVTSPEAAAKLPADKAIDTGVEIVNKDNVAEFKKKLRSLL